MLIIRKEQWDALTEYSRKRAEDRYVKLFFRRYPDESEQMGEPGLRRRITRGMQRCRFHGITDAQHVEQFIDMMFTWGDNFDTSPERPWAARALGADVHADMKMRQLAINATAAQEAEFVKKMKRNKG